MQRRKLILNENHLFYEYEFRFYIKMKMAYFLVLLLTDLRGNKAVTITSRILSFFITLTSAPKNLIP